MRWRPWACAAPQACGQRSRPCGRTCPLLGTSLCGSGLGEASTPKPGKHGEQGNSGAGRNLVLIRLKVIYERIIYTMHMLIHLSSSLLQANPPSKQRAQHYAGPAARHPAQVILGQGLMHEAARVRGPHPRTRLTRCCCACVSCCVCCTPQAYCRILLEHLQSGSGGTGLPGGSCQTVRQRHVSAHSRYQLVHGPQPCWAKTRCGTLRCCMDC